jgi:hypothetical protein
MFKLICVPLLQINSNFYSFLSGIMVSLSTAILFSLCSEPLDLSIQWHQFISLILFLITGIFCMSVATRTARFQNYLYKENIVEKERCTQIIEELTYCSLTTKSYKKNRFKWLFTYICLFVSLFLAFGSLMLNWILRF